MTSLKYERLAPTVGAKILEVTVDQFKNDPALPGQVLEALEEFGVLLFRGLDIDDDTQAEFAHRLGTVRLFPDLPKPEIFEVSYLTENPNSDKLRGNINWHIDGLYDQDNPGSVTMLSAKAISQEGGQTEFASSYNAYDLMTEDEKALLVDKKVVFTFEASQRRVFENPTQEQIDYWRSRPPKALPLVWEHESGRRSLILGSMHDHIEGMDVEEGRAILDRLLARATMPEHVYQHTWEVGDTVFFDNRGLYHRARPFEEGSPRRMSRCTLLGEEPVRPVKVLAA
jgi:alpha-ketoglutarate-dependent taurine dioxygenase